MYNIHTILIQEKRQTLEKYKIYNIKNKYNIHIIQLKRKKPFNMKGNNYFKVSVNRKGFSSLLGDEESRSGRKQGRKVP